MGRRCLLSACVALVVCFGVRPVARVVPPAPDIPAQLSDQEFWKLSADLSEPPGSFSSENLVSNETMFQWVIPVLTRTVKPGGVYLGVAPDQNFTYLIAAQPAIAFIVDIRRGNLLEHLLYKALFEMSADRAEFLSKLFSCARPAGIAPGSSARDLIAPFHTAACDGKRLEANERTVLDWLEKKHGFTLSAADEEQLAWIYSAFNAEGPDLTYASFRGAPSVQLAGTPPVGPDRNGRTLMFFRGPGPGNPYASYGDLQAQADAEGRNHAYLASEANFAWVKAFETRNLIVPLTGDFAGPKAIRAIGTWARSHSATVTTVYTSNVEQYLFQQGDDWSRYYSNVGTLPLDDTSTFIRSIPNSVVRPNQADARAASMLSSIPELVKAFASGTIRTYGEVAALCRQAGK